MVEKEDVELTSPHEYIKNTPTRGTIFTENQLETGRRTRVKPQM